MNILDSLETVLEQIMGVIPKLAGALTLLVVGWIVAKLVSALIARILLRVGLNKLANKLNETEMFQEANLEIKPVGIIKGFIYWTMMLIFVLSAAETLELHIVTQQISALIQYLPQLLTALIILTMGFYLANAIKDMVAKACVSFGIPSGRIISSIVFYILFIALAITALNQAGINTDIITSNLTLLVGGIVLAFAIAYGFAARNVLSSMLTSFYSKGNFHLGQKVEVDTYKGTIVQMNNVSFTLRLEDGSSKVVIPLNRLLNDKVIIHLPSADDAEN